MRARTSSEKRYAPNTGLRWLLVLLMLSVLLSLSWPGVVAGGGQTRPTTEDEEARVVVIIRANPRIQVVPGGAIAYTIQAKNVGERKAEYVRVRLVYDRSQLSIENVQFDDNDGWVETFSEEKVVLHFPVVEGDMAHSSVAYARVPDTLPHGSVIHMWAEYEWVDEGRFAHGNQSNAAPVLVGGENQSSRWSWMTVDPMHGPVGTKRYFFSDRFLPGERIEVYLVSRLGLQRRSSLNSRADGNGRFWIHYETDNLPAGVYQLIAVGHHSDLVGGAGFFVEQEPE
jgi:hypothetical protein